MNWYINLNYFCCLIDLSTSDSLSSSFFGLVLQTSEMEDIDKFKWTKRKGAGEKMHKNAPLSFKLDHGFSGN